MNTSSQSNNVDRVYVTPQQVLDNLRLDRKGSHVSAGVDLVLGNPPFGMRTSACSASTV